MVFFSQEYWSGLPCSPPGDLTNPGIEPTSLMFPALAGRFFITSITKVVLFNRVEITSPPFTVSVTFRQWLNLPELQFPHL